jgi:hypothetical protein
MRVTLHIPEVDAYKCERPQYYGQHFAHNGQSGDVVAPAPNEGAWVHFDGTPDKQYVGCPRAWLQ